MLSQDNFANWANEKVVLFLHNTSRCDDEAYPNLLREKGGNGFPTVSYLAADGRFLKQLSFPTTLDTMQAGLGDLEKWRKLTERAKTDASVRIELFRMELENGMLSYRDATTQLDKLEVDDKTRATFENPLVNLQFGEILRATTRRNRAESGAKLYAMFTAGRIPTSRQITTFWELILAHAVAESDVEMYETILGEMKRRHDGDTRLKRYLPRLERQLEELKKKNS